MKKNNHLPNTFPEKGNKAAKVYNKICLELAMDGNVHLDLGSFSTTIMNSYADKLIIEQLGKNFIDYGEYGQTKKIHDRIIAILSGLLNAPNSKSINGTATLGSSEAIHLALLSHKWNWKKRQQSLNLNTTKPNIVYTSNAHVCWDKFALYFDVEPRKIAISSLHAYPMDEILKNIDENTICVGAIAGNTYTGSIDPIEELNTKILEINSQNNWDVGIHVDAAISGFVLPFLKSQEMQWDFRLSLVRSINLSGHKFGLVYPGIGWLIFRDAFFLPKDLIFSSHYLGKQIETYTLNYSKGASMILAQYFSIHQHGTFGYKKIIRSCCNTAEIIRERLRQSNYFEIVDEGILPVVVFKLKTTGSVDLYKFQLHLKAKNWMLPLYAIPGNFEPNKLMRIVVKGNFNPAMATQLCDDLISVFQKLNNYRL
ncbi:glutamate decarboxylase [Flavobacterium sp. MMLR14_040]|uniref:glutamate decarboxylase n=1 Tax=Flavobacterium sp. MMLR14_040 TaxID=3093843 RepID=UPI00298F976E|nr:glutamate decarboxylase [Flavobacterium sp. MMLR14_040]MDW8850743.1 glutamate decarboxylase [Flavobacterium sp. MMLR14_040]